MIVRTLREYELETKVRELEREVHRLRGQVQSPIQAVECPPPAPASFEDCEREQRRVAYLAHDWDPYLHRYSTLLECSNPRDPERRHENAVLPKWRASYFIDTSLGIKDRELAMIAADMHTRMMGQLYGAFLR